MNLDDKREYIGYNIEYLKKLSNNTNIEFEFVHYNERLAAYEAVCNGEVDLFPTLYKTAEREERLLFSTNTLCDMSIAICAKYGDTRLSYQDYDRLQGKRVGVIEGSYASKEFLRYCKEKDFEVQLVLYGQSKELLAGIENGEIDALATNYLGKSADLRVIDQFYPESMYFAVSPGNEELLHELDDAMDKIALREPGYFPNLYEQYFGTDTSQEPLFTKEEYEYMSSLDSLRVVYVTTRAPISYADPETEEFSGATSKLYQDISRVTGLQFEYIPAADHGEALNIMMSGGADIMYTADTKSSEDLEYMNLTGPFLNTYITRVVGQNEGKNSVALVNGFPLIERVMQENPNKGVQCFATPKLCIDAVLTGKVDAAYVEMNIGNYILGEGQYDALTAVVMTDLPSDLCIGVSAFADPLLLSIMDRCVQYTSETTVSQWMSESMLAAHPTTAMDFLRQNPLQVIAAVTVLLLGLALICGYIIYTRVRNREKITELEYADPLTKGWNLSRFQAATKEILASQTSRKYAIMYFDISRFKSFNAAFGFAEGDKLLVQIFELLKSYTRQGECFARITADEFVVLSEWEGWNYFKVRFDLFDQKLNDIELLNNHAYKVLIAGGVCVVGEDWYESETAITEYIDSARYARESIGEISRSTVELYSDEMKHRDLAERTLFNEAKEALSNGEFVAYYQPKVEIKTGKIKGMEALVRWISPEKGIRNPGEFIPLFERNGFIVTLDMHIFRLACQRIKSRLNNNETVVPISCNFSRLHFHENGFPERIKQVVDEYHIPPHYIELEMTESTVMEDFQRAQAICSRLKDLGFNISIDDFGSGYSSLGTLQNLTFDVLKIDRSLLISSEKGMKSRTILEGTIQIADKLGAEVVVEGVETLKQAAMLQKLDDDIVAQGYLYSRPIDVDESNRQLNEGLLKPNEG